jgi:hypothetical protein
VQPDNTISEGTVDEFGDNFSMSPPGGSDILDLANFAKVIEFGMHTPKLFQVA